MHISKGVGNYKGVVEGAEKLRFLKPIPEKTLKITRQWRINGRF
jgi:hypothetical protein